MALPQGALDALLGDGGTAGFDAVIESDRSATQAAMNTPTVAKNQYNEVVKGGKPAARSEGTTPAPESRSTGVVVPDDEEKPLVIDGGMFDHLVEAPVEDVRAFVGTTRPVLPKPYVELWDEGLEREFLTFTANNQVPSWTAQRLLDWYAEMSIVSSEMPRDWAIKEFHAKFSDLPHVMREKLIEFWTTDVLGNDTTDEGGEAR